MADKLYEQVADELITRIEGAYYNVGQKLPSIRDLSKEYGVSISTVQEAYRLLEERGFTEIRPKSGHFVKARNTQLVQPNIRSLPQKPVEISAWHDIMAMLEADDTGDILNLGWAVPDLDSPTLKPLTKELADINRRQGMRNYAYDSFRGNVKLRRQIARLGVDAGLQLHPDKILITNGCQEALSCSLRAVTQPGDVVAVDSPFYFGAVQIIEACGLKAIEIPSHKDTGISLEAMELALSQWPVKALVLTPTCNNPLGYSIPEKDRPRIVEICNKHDVVLIEDDIYGDLSFQYPRPRSLKSFDTEDRVILCSSFSKTVAPGLRVGWVIPGRYQEQILHIRYISSISISTLPQLAMAEFIAQGAYERHLRRMRSNYQRGRDILIELIQRYFPEGTRMTYPQGGFVIWVELPGDIDTMELNRRARAQGISFAPGQVFTTTDKYRNQMRLNYNKCPSEEVEDAIRILGKLIREMIGANAESTDAQT
ncbi:PLP-dependent aminotransferase family protein [Pontibacterium granulatum]|uniref:aminotransferase-like domain-containing protein n=1 Tax=Pontibacterium granulatum TaxID=2036029 RepID=UPI002499B047|nr:PLP-dependent aminotransferase family protein [Pontibacterium granulatum]MDI3325333.1 PLP-dependent aminotransferase family protein [Pontibacterium granulatum]